jgi:hypothetical protein
MAMTRNVIIDLYTEFTQMRQAGRSRDQAWLGIEAAVSTLSQSELSQLLSMLRSWEAKEGRNHPSESNNDKYNTQPKPPADRNERIEQEEQKSGLIRRLQPTTEPVQPITQRVQPITERVEVEESSPMPPKIPQITCPKCHKMNPGGEIYCYSCGTLLVQPGGTRQIGSLEAEENDIQRDMAFEQDMLLYLRVFGSSKAIRVRPRKDEMVIGRSSPDSVMLPDIDFAPFDAESKGVSRMHAGLRRQGDTLVLTDLGSLNYTFINGQRVHPHEVRVLRNGDELRIGQLKMRVYFRNE